MKAPPKFKKGDRVVCIKGFMFGDKIKGGAEGTFTRLSSVNPDSCYVKFENSIRDEGTYCSVSHIEPDELYHSPLRKALR